ncbi:helix-turn-helix domain-containing protein [Helcococcus kunzii]|uniref:helix-turn-helix domain-containing protein n=1 Tax=Helcococcus kunzii TaxID=40091 RepID=UPI0024AE4007|nr:helix-turn-helix domain-containing protein [Helcococcus kunzii]
MKDIKKSDFPSRLKQIMNDRNISQAELSKITKITASSISDWLNRKYEAKQDKIDIIATALNISPAWLLGYDVPIKKVKIEEKTPILTQSEQQLLKNYNSTTEKGKKRIITTSEEMVELYPLIDRDKILNYFYDNDMQAAALSGKGLNDMSDEELYNIYKVIKGE